MVENKSRIPVKLPSLAFIVCLLISIACWLLVTLSKDYKMTYEFKLVCDNLPEGRKSVTASDTVLTLTFKKELRPEDMKAAKQMFKDFANYLRKEYRKRYYELFWMRNIEVGPRNGWHIHVIVNRIEGAEFIAKDYWRRFGGVFVEYLQDKRDQGKDIGEYIAKSPITCERISDASWSHSRNIKKVEGEDTIISGHAMTDKPRVPKGWYLDKESCYEGTNADGYPYRTYTIRRLKKQRIDHRMPVRKIRAIKDAKRRRKTSGRTNKADNRLARN